MVNSGAFSGLPGVLRLFTLIIGIIDFGLTVDSYLHHFRNEEFFLSVVIICLILSFILAILGFFQLEKVHKADIFFHFLATALLFVGGVLMLYSVFRFGMSYSRWYYTRRISCGVLGIINACVYGIMFWLLLHK